MDGVGAFRYGGRWNSKGTYAVYTASSIALARAELARHINLECIPDNFRIYEIEIPDDEYPSIEKLLPDHDADDQILYLQQLGDQYLRNKEVLAFRVPSVCDYKSFNYILNPASFAYHKIKIIDDYPFVK